MLLFIDSWAVASGLAGWSGAWKEGDWKIGEKDIKRVRMLHMGEGCGHICVLVNAHPKVTSAQEEFSNQVGRMTHSVDSQPLHPAIPVIVQRAHEQSGLGGRDGDDAWHQQHGPLTKADVATAAAECQICQLQGQD